MKWIEKAFGIFLVVGIFVNDFLISSLSIVCANSPLQKSFPLKINFIALVFIKPTLF